jgi:transposase
MAKPLSQDLRLRVVGAIEAGMSRRAAASRFGVAPSAAIKWHALWRKTGAVQPEPQGGDRRSDRIEALAEPILALVDQKADITLAEIAQHLACHHGQRFAPSVVHRFFERRGITFKKNGARHRAGSP